MSEKIQIRIDFMSNNYSKTLQMNKIQLFRINQCKQFIGVFPKCFFTEFSELSDKKFMTLKGLEPATQPPLV